MVTALAHANRIVVSRLDTSRPLGEILGNHDHDRQSTNLTKGHGMGNDWSRGELYHTLNEHKYLLTVETTPLKEGGKGLFGQFTLPPLIGHSTCLATRK